MHPLPRVDEIRYKMHPTHSQFNKMHGLAKLANTLHCLQHYCNVYLSREKAIMAQGSWPYLTLPCILCLQPCVWHRPTCRLLPPGWVWHVCEDGAAGLGAGQVLDTWQWHGPMQGPTHIHEPWHLCSASIVFRLDWLCTCLYHCFVAKCRLEWYKVCQYASYVVKFIVDSDLGQRNKCN